MLGVVLLSGSGADGQGLRVIEKTFCLELERPQCVIPAVSDGITLGQLNPDGNGQRHLYYWTSIEVSEDRNVVHVWAAANRTRPWAERVHLSWAERVEAAALEAVDVVRRTLVNILQSNDLLHSVQGRLLAINRSPRFRTYSSIRAVPGTYSVEVQDLNGTIIENGAARTVTILP